MSEENGNNHDFKVNNHIELMLFAIQRQASRPFFSPFSLTFGVIKYRFDQINPK